MNIKKLTVPSFLVFLNKVNRLVPSIGFGLVLTQIGSAMYLLYPFEAGVALSLAMILTWLIVPLAVCLYWFMVKGRTVFCFSPEGRVETDSVSLGFMGYLWLVMSQYVTLSVISAPVLWSGLHGDPNAAGVYYYLLLVFGVSAPVIYIVHGVTLGLANKLSKMILK